MGPHSTGPDLNNPSSASRRGAAHACRRERETSGARQTQISRRHWTSFASPRRDLAIRRGGRANRSCSRKLPKSGRPKGGERKRQDPTSKRSKPPSPRLSWILLLRTLRSRFWRSITRGPPSRRRERPGALTAFVARVSPASQAEFLRKLDGSLRTQLELPRQPSEGCLLFGSFWSSGTGWTLGPALVQEEGVKHH